MKFIVSSTTLLKHSQLISGAISTNTVLPILENFLFEIKDGKLTIFSTDLETSMSTEMDVESQEDGNVAIPARILLDTLKTLPEQPLTFTIDADTLGIEITTQNGKYKLAGESGSEFPKIPVPDNVQSVSLPAPILQKAVSKTLFAVSNDELRPAMTGVYVRLSDEGTTFVATDAHRLVRMHRHDIKADKEATFIVPKKSLSLLKSALPSSDTLVEVSYNSSNAFFSFEKVNVISRLIDARYPDYNAVIPADNNNRMTIGRNDFLNSLRRISIFSNKTTHQVILNIKGNDLLIKAQDLDFSNEASERLTCSYVGEDIEIGFNARFLVEMVNALDEEEIVLELSTPTRAGLLVPVEQEDNESMLMLVMPVMLNV